MNSAAHPLTRFTSCSLLVLLLGLLSPVQAQSTNNGNSNTLRPSSQNSSTFSIEGGDRLMKEGAEAISGQNYTLATKKLREAREVYNQLSNYYQELNASFSGIDIRNSDSQRKKALETAQKRDEANYQLALVHTSQNQQELAIPLHIQIIKSQNPTRELGKKAYQQLFQIGFVDVPYPANPEANTTAGQNNSNLSIAAGDRLMKETAEAISGQNYTLATKKLREARELYNQLSNYYQELNASFSGIDTKVSDSQRKKALETAQKRDEANYQLALVHRAQNQPELAVPLLVQIIKSQNPTRELGKKAYQQLFELGFVDIPYPRQGNNSSPTSQR
jgi:F0F1-type ATP synthase gamma subunit